MFENLRSPFTSTQKTLPTADQIFRNIAAHDDLKELMGRSILTENRTATMLIGPPGTAKSLFGREICRYLDHWYYFDCTIMSGKGFIDFLYEHKTELENNNGGVVLDEVDKLNKREQTILYNFLETGEIKYQTSKTKYNFTLPKCKVIATSNSKDKLTKPLQSRFAVLYLPEYTFEEFCQIAVNILANEYRIMNEVSREIARVCWNILLKKDVRMLFHIGARIKKEDRAEDIERLILLMQKYGQIPDTPEYN